MIQEKSKTENPETMPSISALGQPTGQLIEKNFTAKWWSPLPYEIIKRVSGKSYKEDCPIPINDLAYVTLTHWNLQNKAVVGELIYHKNLAQEIIEIFKDLFEAQFPIEKLVLIDDYNADDELSMADNNSSAFCSRAITGKFGTFSNHSYGGTIDINPLFNPYVKGETVLPKGSEKFCDRNQNIPGLIKKDDICYTAFVKRGYSWGGDWNSLKDYQHFEKKTETFIKTNAIKDSL